MIVRHRHLQFAITNEIIGQSKEFHILFDVRHLIPDAPQAKTYLLSTTSPCCSLECNCADTKPPITTPLFSKAKSACSPNSYVLKQRHESEIHVQLLVTMEQRHPRAVHHEIECNFLLHLQNPLSRSLTHSADGQAQYWKEFTLGLASRSPATLPAIAKIAP